MNFNRLTQLIQFLRTDLNLPSNSISLVLRQPELTLTSLPMLLWQYGLIDLNQLDQIFDWLEAS